jgi:hypothetical protein
MPEFHAGRKLVVSFVGIVYFVPLTVVIFNDFEHAIYLIKPLIPVETDKLLDRDTLLQSVPGTESVLAYIQTCVPQPMEHLAGPGIIERVDEENLYVCTVLVLLSDKPIHNVHTSTSRLTYLLGFAQIMVEHNQIPGVFRTQSDDGFGRICNMYTTAISTQSLLDGTSAVVFVFKQ